MSMLDISDLKEDIRKWISELERSCYKYSIYNMIQVIYINIDTLHVSRRYHAKLMKWGFEEDHR